MDALLHLSEARGVRLGEVAEDSMWALFEQAVMRKSTLLKQRAFSRWKHVLYHTYRQYSRGGGQHQQEWAKRAGHSTTLDLLLDKLNGGEGRGEEGVTKEDMEELVTKMSSQQEEIEEKDALLEECMNAIKEREEAIEQLEQTLAHSEEKVAQLEGLLQAGLAEGVLSFPSGSTPPPSRPPHDQVGGGRQEEKGRGREEMGGEGGTPPLQHADSMHGRKGNNLRQLLQHSSASFHPSPTSTGYRPPPSSTHHHHSGKQSGRDAPRPAEQQPAGDDYSTSDSSLSDEEESMPPRRLNREPSSQTVVRSPDRAVPAKQDWVPGTARVDSGLSSRPYSQVGNGGGRGVTKARVGGRGEGQDRNGGVPTSSMHDRDYHRQRGGGGSNEGGRYRRVGHPSPSSSSSTVPLHISKYGYQGKSETFSVYGRGTGQERAAEELYDDDSVEGREGEEEEGRQQIWGGGREGQARREGNGNANGRVWQQQAWAEQGGGVVPEPWASSSLGRGGGGQMGVPGRSPSLASTTTPSLSSSQPLFPPPSLSSSSRSFGGYAAESPTLRESEHRVRRKEMALQRFKELSERKREMQALGRPGPKAPIWK
uniref:Uncharacterized protein n=1 Tax=Palpitomonas bilix TaxID=652834 RepID=A0A7S3GDT6_9EUKA